MDKVAILAAYDLENEIQDIVKKTRNYVDLVIVVTDGSKDNTHKMACEAGALCPSHTNTRGKGFAIRKGIDFSKKFKPNYIVLMDADGQHLPEEIPKIIDPLVNNNCDMVLGSRMKGELRTSFVNKIGNICLNVISFFVTGKWITDTESGFRAFKAKELYNLKLEAMSYDIEGDLLLKSLYNNLKVSEVPIIVPKAIPGVTIKDGVKMGWFKIKVGLRLKIRGK